MKTIVAGALGECVHVAGVTNFLRLAEQAGWRVVFLGPAVPIDQLLQTSKAENADMVGVSYRLSPETGARLLGEFAEAADELRSAGVRFVFGGTPPVVKRVRALGFFETCFDGTEPVDEVIAYLKDGKTENTTVQKFPQTTIDRIEWKAPYPLIRHHFGLPDFHATLKGVHDIARAGVVDVISLGIDQDAQENFFHPERQDARRRGAGGVPVRTSKDYQMLYDATRAGNYPLMRTYTGTDDFIQLAEMYVDTINQAWGAIPLFWFNKMDGRGPWDLEGSIREHQKLMSWYGERGIPVELNEPHHWGMRDAPDVVFVVAAYLAAYNARAFGVKDYIAQMMFNSPPGLYDAMDLAKMIALISLIEPLSTDNFRIWRQTRTGLLSYPIDPDAARAHLAASVYLQMALRPHIVHVVGYCEADHAATAVDVIESCKLARRSIKNAQGAPFMTQDDRVISRSSELAQEAEITIKAIRALAPQGVVDPLTDATTLARAVETGLLDAPQLKNNPYGKGQIITQIDQRGACLAIDHSTGKPIREWDRIGLLNIEAKTYLNNQLRSVS
jgi:methylmalonyl-CoA mutase cobalamin-binding subunit